MSIKTETALIYYLGTAIQIIKRQTSYNEEFTRQAELAVKDSVESMSVIDNALLPKSKDVTPPSLLLG